ncbi:HD domain-containing protein [Clostridium botulinum C]|uniref:HD domain-containing protein n=4 Tax=Clostridium TaxID=1485 RepID=A0A9Q4TSK0_CLOBO|nr:MULTISPECIES: HD domain-containing protein [Clostridium]EES92310.1 HD superfamily hydrolase [Clostridium botulinum D str. 1873]KEI09237.1 phosphohydrolase [Clostridium sp. K25]MBO3442523.1 HD domain-containing protein [Clostridium haemolyticum]MCD3195830.1 HD domain-containing protein [Clostridium botulinum C]MCD3201246.1 HD domain-containing protein [Clostridium botulinum C]
MDRIDKILKHKKYTEYTDKIKKIERNREWCHHDIDHSIDVCRIMYIINLENKLSFNKDVIYACGLLHDVGRWQQYEESIPHEIASANLSEEILKECDFNKDEIFQILKAIKNHRNKENEKESLSELLYKSDKLSRSCFKCSTEKKCYWLKHKKNLKMKY